MKPLPKIALLLAATMATALRGAEAPATTPASDAAAAPTDATPAPEAAPAPEPIAPARAMPASGTVYPAQLYTRPNLPPRQMEKLGRGVVALNQGDGKVWVSWRLLGTEPADLGFNVYRSAGGGAPVKLNAEPLTTVTCYQDTGVDTTKSNEYFIRPVLNGREGEQSKRFLSFLPANAPVREYVEIPIKTPEGYTINDCSVGDLDGDGEYEIVVHLESGGHDNSQAGFTGDPLLQAYKMDGTFLWQINLGKNIREGAHYTQFMVYDLDGDGRAEVVCKTAPGTVDGQNHYVTLHDDDPTADYRNDRGYVLAGPEYLTVFDGLTGKALATTDYVPARGNVGDWGDTYGNRLDRYLACIAYLDGVHPSVVMCRGYYTRTNLVAWDWRDGKLTQRWWFDSDTYGTAGRNNPYSGQGNHGLSVADVDGDGKDDIIYGAMCINSDGTPRYSTRLGHGDAMHVSDLDPTRPGLEVFDIHENPRHPYGIEFRDANTGELIWGKPGGTENSPDVARGISADIDPRYPGAECWSSLPGLYSAQGERISNAKPGSVNFCVLWDGDTLYELLNSNYIEKWNWEAGRAVRLLTADECTSNNSTKSTPCLSGDILGDWREEVVWRTRDNQALHIYVSTIPTNWRTYTLMHDPQYRLAIAWQNTSYNQPPHTGFYFGANMPAPPKPNIVLVEPKPVQ